jgi:hypothetical protein
MWPAHVWTGWPGTVLAAPVPARCDRILARTRHPSFTSAIADDLVADLSRRQLRRLWRSSSQLLGVRTLCSTDRLHLVILRQHLLDRLDVLDAS